MAVIYLKHDVHGRKVACSEQEAVYDETKGWARYDVGVLLTPKKEYAEPVSAAPAEPEAVLQRRSRRRMEQTA